MNKEKKIQEIKKYYMKLNKIPQLRDAMKLLNLKSTNSISRLYNSMVEIGYLEKRERTYYPTDLLGSLPLWGSVQAGNPTDEPSEIEDNINISTFLIEHPESTFLATIRGDSMKDAGLVEGDIVVVDKTYNNPQEDDIVIATVDNDSEFTVKYFKTKNGEAFLVPANKKYSIIMPKESLTIHGKVIGSLRKY